MLPLLLRVQVQHQVVGSMVWSANPVSSTVTVPAVPPQWKWAGAVLYCSSALHASLVETEVLLAPCGLCTWAWLYLPLGTTLFGPVGSLLAFGQPIFLWKNFTVCHPRLKETLLPDSGLTNPNCIFPPSLQSTVSHALFNTCQWPLGWLALSQFRESARSINQS